MKQNILFGLALLLTTTFCFAQKTKIDSLFSDFKQASFYGRIYPAKMKLESYQKEIIPQTVFYQKLMINESNL